MVEALPGSKPSFLLKCRLYGDLAHLINMPVFGYSVVVNGTCLAWVSVDHVKLAGQYRLSLEGNRKKQPPAPCPLSPLLQGDLTLGLPSLHFLGT